jgi:hypothetical protein
MKTWKVIYYSIVLSLIISSFIILNKTFDKLHIIIEEKNIEISVLNYKLLNCKLNTINEINSEKANNTDE